MLSDQKVYVVARFDGTAEVFAYEEDARDYLEEILHWDGIITEAKVRHYFDSFPEDSDKSRNRSIEETFEDEEETFDERDNYSLKDW